MAKRLLYCKDFAPKTLSRFYLHLMDALVYGAARRKSGGVRMGYQRFYYNKQYKILGFSSLEDFLIGFWEGFFLDDRDANILLAMLWAWQKGDVSRAPGMSAATSTRPSAPYGPELS